MQVWHMSGAGNDFMVLDARGKVLDYPALAKKALRHDQGRRLHGRGYLR